MSPRPMTDKKARADDLAETFKQPGYLPPAPVNLSIENNNISFTNLS